MIDFNDKTIQIGLISGISGLVGGSILTLGGLKIKKNVDSKTTKSNIPTIISFNDINEMLYDNKQNNKSCMKYKVGGNKKSLKKRNNTKKRSQKKR